MNRSTALGRLFRIDAMKGRQEVLHILRRHAGKIYPAAHEIGWQRRSLIRVIWREALWSELDKIRAEGAMRHVVYDDEEWLARTRAALRVSTSH